MATRRLLILVCRVINAQLLSKQQKKLEIRDEERSPERGESGEKKSNDNYGPKIKLFICVPAAHISAFGCRAEWAGMGARKEPEKYEEINCEKSLRSNGKISSCLRAVHMYDRRTR